MSAAKHTPGPWELRASTDTVDFGIIVRDERAKGGWAVIAEAFSEIRHAGERAPEGLPNARLIAAAPELLEALHAFMALDKSFSTICDEHLNDMAKDGPMARAVKLARAAIAKATGAAS